METQRSIHWFDLHRLGSQSVGPGRGLRLAAHIKGNTKSMTAKYFTVDARAMLTWGRDSIKDHATAVLELVKNSYDAGASIVEVSILAAPKDNKDRVIRISDDGIGMKGKQVDRNWLRIGYSEKLKAKRSRSGRRKTGEKGIGRISADRLGALLELRTQARNATAVGLTVDWDAFQQGGLELSHVELPTIDEPEFNVPQPSTFDSEQNRFLPEPRPKRNSKICTGTELKIYSLRHQWTPKDIEELRQELSVLTPPFEPVADFQIRVDNDLDSNLNGVLLSPFYQTAEIEAEFSYAGNGAVDYQIRDRDAKGRIKVNNAVTTSWGEFVHMSLDLEETKAESLPTCGPIKVRLLFYPRVAETLRGTDFSVTQLKAFLDINAGIKVYRDNIRVMPYGSVNRPEGDWLGLGDRKARSPAGAARRDFRVAPNQIVGAVLLARDENRGIVDTSGREGLIHSDQFNELKAFLLSGCLPALEAHYHKIYSARKKQQLDASPRETIREVNASLHELSTTLRTVESQLPKGASRQIERLRDQISSSRARLQKLQKSSEELASQATTYRGLATLGITAATFGHETELTLDSCFASLNTAQRLLKRSQTLGEASEELAKAIEYGKRISAWGAFALKRVGRDKRRKKTEDITGLVTELVKGLRPAFTASDIDIRERYAPVIGETFAMDVESVVLNLLTNAYYFTKLKNKDRVVSVSLKKARRGGENGFEIAVGDSGPGVRATLRDGIWQPLFSTKVDRAGRPFGTGLGLAIVDSVVRDLGGMRSVASDPHLKGARFTVWLKLK